MANRAVTLTNLILVQDANLGKLSNCWVGWSSIAH
jgi:hypothetical protein